MTVLMLTDGIPPFVMGGMQKHSQLLCEQLGLRGVKVHLLHYVYSSLPTDEEVLAFFSEQARPHIAVHTFLYSDSGKMPGHYLRAQYKMSKRYFEHIRKLDVHANFIYTKGFMGKALLERRDELGYTVPIGVKFHGMNMFQLQPDWRGEITKYMLRGPVRRIMNRADYVFSYGGKITDIIAAELTDQSKIVEFPSGVTKDWIVDSITEPVGNQTLSILFVGRYDRLKGLEELFQAIDGLPSGSDLRFSFVGPIPESVRKNDNRLHFHGPVSDPNVLREFYDDHDVLICPSISEGMPNVIMEAMARGLAIIASDVGATRSLVDDQNGWLILPGDVDAIREALVSCLHASKAVIKGKKEASLEKMRQGFTWERIGERFVHWLESHGSA